MSRIFRWRVQPPVSLKPCVRQRRVYASASTLLEVPGIGKRALDRLQKASVESVDKLCHLYVEEHGRKKEQLIKYLKGLGIHTRWTHKIADWVEDNTSRARALTFCVEGNVGAGKSTFLENVRSEQAEEESCVHELIEVVPEPVNEWQTLETGNLLDMFYKNPEKYAFAFQQYVLMTRIKQEQRSRSCDASLRLLERSVFCDRMVFVRAVHALKQLNNVELEIYDSWFNPLIEMQPQLIPDGFVYLKTDAKTCARRIEKRQRSEEAGVPLGYLEVLNGLHDNWLVQGGQPVVPHRGSDPHEPAAYTTTSTLFPASAEDTNLSGTSLRMHQFHEDATTRDIMQLKIPPVPSLLHGNVVLLDSNKLKTSSEVAASSRLHLVPALHVDCVDDVDIGDAEVVAHRAQVMREYRSWVKQYTKDNKDVLQQARANVVEVPQKSSQLLASSETIKASGSLEILSEISKGKGGKVMLPSSRGAP